MICGIGKSKRPSCTSFSTEETGDGLVFKRAVSFGDGAINITGDKENVDYHNNLNGKHTILFP